MGLSENERHPNNVMDYHEFHHQTATLDKTIQIMTNWQSSGVGFKLEAPEIWWVNPQRWGICGLSEKLGKIGEPNEVAILKG